MATTLTSTTIRCGARTFDVAVPEGTTVGSVIHMLGAVPAQGPFQVTRADGGAVTPSMRLGHDLASGTLLHVAARGDTDPAEHSAASAGEHHWVPAAIVTALTLSVVTASEITFLIGPALGWWPVPGWLRAATAVVCGPVLVVALLPATLRRSPWGLPTVTALLGVTSVVVVPFVGGFTALMVAALVGWAALGATLLVWALDRSRLAAATAVVWWLSALTFTVAGLTDVHLPTLAALLLAAATLSIGLVPTLAFRAPETQLLHLPAVTTSSATVRAPKVLPPARITGPRVRRSLRDAEARSQLLLLTASTVAAVTAFPAATLARPGSPAGWAGLVLLLCACLGLLLTPRGSRDRLTRILPRVAAVAVVMALLTSSWVLTGLGGHAAAAVAVGLAVASGLGVVVMTRGRESAWLGHIGDLAQRTSLQLVLPAAVLAGHLFETMWRVMS
ncbi:hypothetical protein EII34_10925 [Arachnia propionica]|uniref:EccD-like transmembrane domain-containing protein n=1 Tax=Arachnia propionica TaxID=1750 RepID=A0A3P1T589_9ACTN|nr:hypothetical protein [Arachnia propionica]RRD04335.1 hypothetical protein EII34_10925 [Arachnia propionica]